MLPEVLLVLSYVGVESGPIYSYSYASTTSYGLIEYFRGDHFYEMKRDRIFFRGYYCLGDRSCGRFGFDSGYNTPKQSKGVQLSLSSIFSWPLGSGWTLEIEPEIVMGGIIKNTPCIDSIGRNFHCYFGTQPSSSFFYASYEEINASYRQPLIQFSNVEVRIKWVF